MVLYTIVKYSIQYGWKKSLNKGYIVRFEHSSGFCQQKFISDLQKVYGNGALKYATVCKWVRHFNDGRESIEMTLGWVGGFRFDRKERCYCENVN